MRFAFVTREKAHHSILRLCRVLGVSPSGYYAWRKREPAARTQQDQGLTARIRVLHEASRRTSGAPRIHADLRADGVRCGRKRVARLMRAAGVVGCHRRRPPTTTRREATAPPAADQVRRAFVATAPDRLWTADITYVPTGADFLYLAVVLDLQSRRIVGWTMADHLRTELVLAARDRALWQRRPAPGVIHHSNHGCQYTALAFGARSQEARIVPSMGTVGDCYDNEVTESFFATLECDLLNRQPWRTHAAARTAIFDFIEGFSNPHRRHTALAYLSPAAYERRLERCAIA